MARGRRALVWLAALAGLLHLALLAARFGATPFGLDATGRRGNGPGRARPTPASSAPGVRISRDRSTPDPVGFLALDVPAGADEEIVLTSAGWP